MAVNADDEDHATVQKFVSELELPYTVLIGGRKVFTGDYRGKGYPDTYLVDPQGNIVYAHSGWRGERDLKKLNKRVHKLLSD